MEQAVNTQDSTKKIIAKDLKNFTEERNCPDHGLVMHRIMKTPFDGEIKTCSYCQGREEKVEEKRIIREREEQVKSLQVEINRRLENAMIAPRFAQKTLEGFEISSVKQKKAVEAAQWLLNNLDSGSPGLIFLGNNGTGKNHLASAIVREAITKYKKTALITKVRKLDRAIKETWKKDGLESEAIKLFSQPDLLVIDEIGLQRGSETELLHLAEIIDDRYEAMKPTILCGNVTLAELKEIIGDRAIDRFREGGKVVIFDWQSYRKAINAKTLEAKNG